MGAAPHLDPMPPRETQRPSVRRTMWRLATTGGGYGTAMPATTAADTVLAGLDAVAADLEKLYQDVHAHPELSLQERRTAGVAAAWLREAGWDVTEGVGGTGVVGLLRNGDGPTVMLRADMDALPVREQTGLPYASTVTATDSSGREVPVMHACGHDMHVTWLAGVTTLLARAGDAWRGTVLAVFQPAEETAQGARAMIDDGLFDRFPKPEVILGQHVMPARAGEISYRIGTTQAAADSLEVRLFGRGAHGSMPESSVDPVVMAAATVLRLQTIVSREVAAREAAVVTVGALQAGDKDNVIPDAALLRINVRTFDEAVRRRVLDAIARIVEAEATASNAPRRPEIVTTEHYPLTVNDPDRTRRVAVALRARFGDGRVRELAAPVSASEDFGSFGTEWGVPSVFWYVGGTDPDLYRDAERRGTVAQDVPTNHNPAFAPVVHPTLETGVQAMTAAALDAMA
jgi:amidohydrolase